MFLKNEKTAFDTIDFLIEETNYTLTDLRNMYVLDLFRVMGNVKKRLSRK